MPCLTHQFDRAFNCMSKIKKICKECGKEFEVSSCYYTRKFCSHHCSMKWRNRYDPRAGYKKGHISHNDSRNPSKSQSKLLKICEFCGKSFKIYPSGQKRRFCSISCSSKWGNKHNSEIGYKKEHDMLPTWGFQKDNQYGKRNIGNTYGHANKGREAPWTKTSKNRERCRKKWLGKNNPNWIDGSKPNPYTIEFNNDLKEQIKKWDNHICQLCEKTEQQELIDLGMKLCTHHIDYNKQNCNLNNLISLCHACHAKTISNRKYWTTFFQAKVSLRNLSNRVYACKYIS